MSDPFIGQITIFAGNYAPEGWSICNGSTLSVNDYAPLFSLIGYTYGGNGATTFALPDLRGRLPIGSGTGPKLSSYKLGDVVGAETVTLTAATIPAHNHAFNAQNIDATSTYPTSNPVTTSNDMSLAKAGVGDYLYSITGQGSPTAVVLGDSVSNSIATGNQPHLNIMPVMVLNYIICIQNGIYPDLQ